jgi:hypothetical protein
VKRFKNFLACSKSLYKIGGKGKCADEQISTIKKKPSTLYQDNKKDVFRVLQESVRTHSSQPQVCKSVNSFERFILEKKAAPGHPVQTEHLWKLSSQNSLHCAQPTGHSKALQSWSMGA